MPVTVPRGVGHAGGRRPEGPRRRAAAASPRSSWSSARRAGPTRPPTPRRWTWSRRSSPCGPRSTGRKRKLQYEDAERQAAAVLAALAGRAAWSSRSPDEADRKALLDTGDDERRRRGSTARCASWSLQRHARVRGRAGAAAGPRVRRRTGPPLGAGGPAAASRSSDGRRSTRLAGELQPASSAAILAAGPGPGGRQPADPADRREAGGRRDGRAEPRPAGRRRSTGCTRRYWRRRACWAASGRRSSPQMLDVHRAAAATPTGASRSGKLDYELFDQAVGAYDWYCLEELRKRGRRAGAAGRRGRRGRREHEHDSSALRAELDAALRRRTCSCGRRPRTTSSRRWTAPCRCPAGATSGRSRSSTASTCWPPACGR